MADMSMEEMLAAAQQFTQEAYETASEDWWPPDGRYTVKIGKPRSSTYQKEGRTAFVLNVPHIILDGPNANKTFDVPFFSTNKVHLQTLKNFVSTATGAKPTGQFAQDVRNLVAAAPDRLFDVEVVVKPSNTGGQGFNNIKYLKMLQEK